MANFQDLAKEFIVNNAAYSIANAKDLAELVLQLLNNTELSHNIVLNASNIIKKYNNVLDHYYSFVLNHIDISPGNAR